MLDGVGRMPIGQRRTGIHDFIHQAILPVFSNRVLPFNESGASAYADLNEKTRRAGYTVSMSDCMIGAMAKANGFAVATRDIAPFEAMGLPVINPFVAT